MTALLTVAKKRAIGGPTLTYPATTAYKQWVWKEIRRRDKTLQWLVDEMKRVARKELIESGNYETISTASLINLLGAEKGAAPTPSNCAFMPALNKALGLAPPPLCDPTDELAQLSDRFRAKWNQLDNASRTAILALLGDRETQ